MLYNTRSFILRRLPLPGLQRNARSISNKEWEGKTRLYFFFHASHFYEIRKSYCWEEHYGHKKRKTRFSCLCHVFSIMRPMKILAFGLFFFLHFQALRSFLSRAASICLFFHLHAPFLSNHIVFLVKCEWRLLLVSLLSIRDAYFYFYFEHKD